MLLMVITLFMLFLRFHVAASKGLLNSLNVFLDNGVNVKAVDAAGKTSCLCILIKAHILSRSAYDILWSNV